MAIMVMPPDPRRQRAGAIPSTIRKGAD